MGDTSASALGASDNRTLSRSRRHGSRWTDETGRFLSARRITHGSTPARSSGYRPGMLMSDELREVERDALEAGVLRSRRLGEHGLPTSVADQRLLGIDNDELRAWR